MSATVLEAMRAPLDRSGVALSCLRQQVRRQRCDLAVELLGGGKHIARDRLWVECPPLGQARVVQDVGEIVGHPGERLAAPALPPAQQGRAIPEGEMRESRGDGPATADLMPQIGIGDTGEERAKAFAGRVVPGTVLVDRTNLHRPTRSWGRRAKIGAE